VLVLDAPGLRIVARPDALDRAVWHDAGTGLGFALEDEGADPGPLVIRFAPDEALALVGSGSTVDIDDPDAIVVEETGFLALGFDADEFATVVVPHIEWAIPAGPASAQGAIAGVPAKLRLGTDGSAWLLAAKAYEHEIRDRLGIRS
jgi:hypothetical protein